MKIKYTYFLYDYPKKGVGGGPMISVIYKRHKI
jgi:hypothetical protein